MNDNSERTRLIERERARPLVHESFELVNQRRSRSGDAPIENQRSAEEIGIDASLEPALGRKTWKGYLILILTPLVLCPLPVLWPTQVSDFSGAWTLYSLAHRLPL